MLDFHHFNRLERQHIRFAGRNDRRRGIHSRCARYSPMQQRGQNYPNPQDFDLPNQPSTKVKDAARNICQVR